MDPYDPSVPIDPTAGIDGVDGPDGVPGPDVLDDAVVDPTLPAAGPVEGLDPRHRELLDFERGWWLEDGPKSVRIRARLGCSPTRYYERLAALLDDPVAFAYDPLTVKRLRRLRDQRRRARYEGYTADPRSR